MKSLNPFVLFPRTIMKKASAKSRAFWKPYLGKETLSLELAAKTHSLATGSRGLGRLVRKGGRNLIESRH